MNNTIEQYQNEIPELRKAIKGQPVLWLNDKKCPEIMQKKSMVSKEQIEDAKERLERFAPYIATVFPETAATHGIIESELREIHEMKEFLSTHYDTGIPGRLFLKMDSHLPISGSIKARGGIYEVLAHAENLALNAGLLKTTDGYEHLAREEIKEFFHQYTIQVGSTGNLGLSIGIISAQLGFQVVVHMSADAKQWKKDMLRSKGVTVVEYESDYCAAVEEGRKKSDENPDSYFVDDENSVNLFLGYAVAGKRLETQLKKEGIIVDDTHPLFVYLPCGIGGAPGGVAHGLKEIYGDAVHCFFSEPTQACCMMLGMATGEHDGVSVEDFGISGKTDADGLAVGRPSAFVGRVIEQRLSGICTIEDSTLYELMRGLYNTEQIFIEPSACAAFATFLQKDSMINYIKKEQLETYMDQATHVAWATGGNMVPKDMVTQYLNKRD